MKAAALAEILKKVPVFDSAGTSLAELAKKLVVRRYDKGADIFKEGDIGTCLYLIMSGRVLIYTVTEASGQEVTLQNLGPADFFGEMGLLDGGWRSAGARALEDVLAFKLEHQDLMDFLSTNPQVAIKIIEVLTQRLRQANAHLKIMADCQVQACPAILEQVAAVQPAPAAGGPLPGEMIEEGGDLAAALEEQLEQAEQERQEANAHKEAGIIKMIYYKKITCPCCANKYETPKVLSRHMRVNKVDNDYCKHYDTVNPLFYEISVCPSCGMALDEEMIKEKLSVTQKERIAGHLARLNKGQLKEYGGLRTLEQAVETFLLALYTLEGRLARDSKKGMMNLKTAWLHRFKGDGEKERKYLGKALTQLSQAYENESFTEPRSELNIVYMLGALHFRSGNYQEAARWLERILRNKNAETVALPLVNQARELWSDIRQGMRNEKEKNGQGAT